MWIMTKNGWRQLQPKVIAKPEPAKAYNSMPAPYQGTFPSADLCAFFNGMKDSHLKYFDDGVRMVYGRADEIVAVDNLRPGNIIADAPKGWEDWQ